MDLILKSEIVEVKQMLISVVLDIQSGECQRDPQRLGDKVEAVIKRLDEIEPK
ncbi:hypothetical protein [Sutcliffiella horikoshii]|uniref:hypothetical protein n=1 Tax=Sutcliffiella horikoshii TaxID=79883 RepID=UPI00165396E8|nr:hypothetical protein [Sutcliffiella horikoshii]